MERFLKRSAPPASSESGSSPAAPAPKLAKVDPETPSAKADKASGAVKVAEAAQAEVTPSPVAKPEEKAAAEEIGKVLAEPAGAWPTGEELRSPTFTPERCSGKGPVPYGLLCDAFAAIEELKGTGKGSKKVQTNVLSNLYRTILVAHKQDLVPALYLSINKLAPEYENVELGLGDQLLMKGICEVYGRSEAAIKQSLATEEACDLGEVASQSRVNQKSLCKPKPHLLAKVFEELHSIANQKGKESMTKRKGIVRKLLVAAQGEEPKYIIRTLQGKLRIGVQKQTVLQALASAFVLTRPTDGGMQADIRVLDPKPSEDDVEKKVDEMEAAVKRAFCSIPSFGEVVPALLSGNSPDELVKTCAIRVGVPISPMLAKPTKGITEILDRFQNVAFTAEFKYDGERAQVHISGDKLQVYSRNSENTSGKYPDVVEVVRGALKPNISSCILDTEVVAFDPATKKILPFQTLTHRAKKNVSADSIQVTVCVYAFDLILLDGESLCGLPLSERRKKLRESLNEVEDKLTFAKYRDMNAQSQEDLEAFLQESIDGSCEGLMLKTLEENATYEPSRRSLNWLKLKKDYLDGLGDSVDLVVLGAWHGKGKRAGTYGAFLLGVYDPEEEGYQTTCKVGTGFSDQDLKDHHAFFSPKAQAEKPSEYDVDERLDPDVWFEPSQVWECKAADLQVSPIHTAAKGAKATGKGIGLRFPRFLRIREDKNPENATQASQIVDMFEAQAVQAAGNAARAGDDDDDDF